MPRILLLSCIVVGIWGSTWVVMRSAIAHHHLSPEGMALGRHLVASLVFLVALAWRRPPPLARGEFHRLAWAGAIGIGFYNLLTGWGQRSVDAGTAAVIIQTAPVTTALGAWWLLGQRVGVGTWIGLVAACLGIALIGLGGSPGAGGTLPDLLCLVAASLAFSGYNLWTTGVAGRIGGWWTTAWAVWIGTVVLLPWSGSVVQELQERPLIALGVWTYLGVLATAGAYAAWTVLAASLPLARAAIVLYLVPVLALGLGWALLGEAPGMLGLAGVACILGGVVIARRTAA